MNALGIFAFAVALLASVVIHEGGHFLTAKAFGMKATQFFVGFGPTLFSRRRGETEYGIKALPAGGFVKIVGMTPLEVVDPADAPRAFFRQPTPQRFVVLAAGSVTHLVIAVLLVVGIAFAVPQPHPTGAGKVFGVSACVGVTDPTLSTPVGGTCPSGSEPSPAAAAGLRTDDVITALDGRPLTSYADLTSRLRRSPTAAVTLTVRRDGHTLDVPVTLAPVKRNLATGGPGPSAAYALGVSGGDDVTYRSPTFSQGRHQAAALLGTGPTSITWGTFRGLAHLPSSLTHLFSADRNQRADTATPQSVVGIARVSGTVLADRSEPLSVRIGDVLYILAAVNFFIGVLNLLPLLPFDGGHIAVTLAERWTRGRRRTADAGARITAFYTRAAPAMYVVFAAFVVMSLVVLYADIANPGPT